MNKSFTIIELLVVITIIGILSSILVISITEAINSANDAKKEATINQIAKALTLYHVDNNSYPAMSCRIGDSGCLDFLVPQYISTLPDYETYSYAYSSVDGNEFAIMTIGSKILI